MLRKSSQPHRIDQIIDKNCVANTTPVVDEISSPITEVGGNSSRPQSGSWAVDDQRAQNDGFNSAVLCEPPKEMFSSNLLDIVLEGLLGKEFRLFSCSDRWAISVNDSAA